jgi:ABC-type polysaccharide/polyol phosphate transport system ATPase subunit
LRKGTIAAAGIWKRFRADRKRAYFQDEIARVLDRARSRTGSGWRWALRDINFHLEPGESVGLIGANGSGKTTLLKILTQVMYPTAGGISVDGRIGALINISAGIHPNLTGRENIITTGSLMGLPRRAVAEKFDEIVEFAELEHAIDRQAKYYSAGMLTRLGFGVAAFLEPDILLVDEVLAVGDASFQQRCLDRLRYVLGQGTTLVFVSHDLAAVEATCRRGVWLHNGEVESDGGIREVLNLYRASVEAGSEIGAGLGGKVKMLRAGVAAGGSNGGRGGVVQSDGPIDLELTIESETEYRAWIYLGVSEGTAAPIFVVNPGRETLIAAGQTIVRCTIPRLPLPRGPFYFWMGIYDKWTDGDELFAWQPISKFDVYGPELDAAPRAVVRLAPLRVDTDWAIERV